MRIPLPSRVLSISHGHAGARLNDRPPVFKYQGRQYRLWHRRL